MSALSASSSLSLTYSALQLRSSSATVRSSTQQDAVVGAPAASGSAGATAQPKGHPVGELRRLPLMTALFSAIEGLRSGATASPGAASAQAPEEPADAAMDFTHALFHAMRALARDGGSSATAAAASGEAAVSTSEAQTPTQTPARHPEHQGGHGRWHRGERGWGMGGLADRLEALAARLTPPVTQAATPSVSQPALQEPVTQPLSSSASFSLQLSMTQAQASLVQGGQASSFSASVSTVSLQFSWSTTAAVGSAGTPAPSPSTAEASPATAPAATMTAGVLPTDPMSELLAAFSSLYERLQPQADEAAGPQQLADFLRQMAQSLRGGAVADAMATDLSTPEQTGVLLSQAA
jgi:hypothetical protein